MAGRKQCVKELQREVDDGQYVSSTLTVLELGRRWLREHVQPNLKPGAAANYKSTFYKHVAPRSTPSALTTVGPRW
jgi:hypothetical protein